MYYILNEENEPVKVDALTWASWFEEHDYRRIVARSKVDTYLISTVFLGIDHRAFFLSPGVPPILWETMVFKDDDEYEDLDMWRYDSHKDAVYNHRAVVCEYVNKTGCKEEKLVYEFGEPDGV